MSQLERAFMASLKSLAGLHYDTSPGASKDPASTDCVRFVEDFLSELCGEFVKEMHADLMVMDGSRPYSNVEAVVKMSLGEEVDAPVPGRIHICQGWASLDPLKRGHAWVWYSNPLPFSGPDGTIIQATTSPAPWVRDMNWSEQAAKFPGGVRIAALEQA